MKWLLFDDGLDTNADFIRTHVSRIASPKKDVKRLFAKFYFVLAKIIKKKSAIVSRKGFGVNLVSYKISLLYLLV